MSSEKRYFIEWCPVCRQGWIEIVIDNKQNVLFVYCNECETEWENPEYIKIKDSGTFGNYGDKEIPTFTEIQKQGWDKFIK